jgi:hypothetical protein
MRHIRVICPFLAAAALVACGSGSSTGTTSDFQAAAPTYEKLAISQNDADTVEPSDSAGTGLTADTDAATPDCHPHLFARTNEIIQRVNRHFRKILFHVEDVIEDNPLSDGQTRTFERVRAGLDRKFTITRTANADGSLTFDFELDIAAIPASGTLDFVKVMSGSITHVGPLGETADAGSEQVVEDKGTVTFDFTALASVEKNERARGQITDTFDNLRDPVKGVKRSANIALTDFVPEEGDRHGPRTGSYSWLREPGIGGEFQFQDTEILFCLPNPAGMQSDLTTVARWYRASDGAVHGRADARATGGQLPSGDQWLGVTCAEGPTTTAPAEGFWMMKLEDGSGATVAVRLAQNGVQPCDPAFGGVPSPTDNKTDYDFTAPVSFPGEF